MGLDGSDEFRVGFEWICQDLMAREYDAWPGGVVELFG